jgi:uncharacterized protein (TIGR04551 family)
MRRFLLVNCVIGLALLALPAAAQPRPRPARDARPTAPAARPEEAAVDASAEEDEEEEEDAGDASTQLRAPMLEAPDLSGVAPSAGSPDEGEGAASGGAEEGADEAAPVTNEPGDETLLSPEADEARLAGGSADAQSDATAPDAWTAPQSIFTLHGYFRGRGDLQDTFHLGRPWSAPGPGGALTPFDNWVPVERRAAVAGGCGASECDTEALASANMRLRLMPQLNLSDDVRVKMWIDVFDNVLLGSSPDTLLGDGSRSAFAGAGSAGTSLPSSSWQSTLTDSIVARRAWAEVRNRTLGELRFGRMGWHWGLGMVANAGDNLDGDYSTDVDRLMGVTRLAGLYLMAAYDFANSGVVGRLRADESGRVVDAALPYDPAQRDDATQYMFAVARRSTAEEQTAALERGEFVLNAGAFLLYRYQLLSSDRRVSATGESPAGSTGSDPYLVRRRAEQWIPDVWAQLLVGKLRLELEGAAVLGSLGNINDGVGAAAYTGANLNIAQWGATVDAEYRMLDDKLGFHFNSGFASGDSEAANDGLGAFVDSTARAPGRDGAISTFRFHPNYRVDLILWRSILRQVSGAYYFRPGVSYDFLRSEFGQLLGGRVDLVYSRASSTVQTWGNDANLGVEVDASIYYRSEDGPELLDGFYAMAQYGLLFPMQGLGYLSNATSSEITTGNPELKNAQTLRLILGVQF